MCIDYRPLNAATHKDAFPLPRIDETLDKLSNACWFSTTDLASGYWQVSMAEEAKEKTAFCTRNGLFHWNVMPFGVTNAPATFQRLMESVVGEMEGGAHVFLDDVILQGSDFEEMLSRLDAFFQCLQSANLKLKPRKCCFFQKSVAFLGHIVSEKGIQTSPEKVAAVKNWPVPTTRKRVRSFLGLVSYYRRYIKGFSTMAKPLTNLTSIHVPFVWGSDCQESFESLKECLVSAPILGYPMDVGSFILDTDASDVGIAGVLSQMQGNEEVVLSYASHTLNSAERNYCVTRRELLAIVHHVEVFRSYLIRQPFLVRTDHSSLKYLKRFKQPEGQLARWLDFLQQFEFEIEHRPGKLHGNADALSRLHENCGGKKCFCPQFDTLELEPPVTMEVHDRAEVAVQTDDGFVARTVQCFDVSYGAHNRHVDQRGTQTDFSQLSRTVSINPLWTEKELQEMQTTDPDVNPVMVLLEKFHDRPSWSDYSHLSSESKILISKWEDLKIIQGVLYLADPENGSGPPKLVLPRQLWSTAVSQAHDHVTAGHGGQCRTLIRVRTRFFFPRMREYVSRWVRTCKICQRRKGPTQKAKAPLQRYLIGAPCERVATDLMGPFTESDRGNKWILVIGDYFTKYSVAIPLQDITSKTVAEALINYWVSYFGVPYELHSDRGTQYESHLFHEVCELLGIAKTRTTVMRPQSDGFVERLNRTLCDMLNCTAENYPFSWDLLIRLCTLAYNAHVQSSTGETPSVMMMGRETKLPIDLLSPLPAEATSMELNASDFVVELQGHMHAVHKLARVKMQGAAVKQQSDYNNRLKVNDHPLGSQVYYFEPAKGRGAPKEARFLWQGPYEVVEKLSPTVYKIRKSLRSKLITANHDSLKQAHIREQEEEKGRGKSGRKIKPPSRYGEWFEG